MTDKMSDLLKAATITAEMIERRDNLKLLFGSTYDDTIRDVKHIVQGVSRERGIPIVEAGLAICKQAVRDDKGGIINLVIASMVDLCEEKAKDGQHEETETPRANS